MIGDPKLQTEPLLAFLLRRQLSRHRLLGSLPIACPSLLAAVASGDLHRFAVSHTAPASGFSKACVRRARKISGVTSSVGMVLVNEVSVRRLAGDFALVLVVTARCRRKALGVAIVDGHVRVAWH